jgi:hypothetical protein
LRSQGRFAARRNEEKTFAWCQVSKSLVPMVRLKSEVMEDTDIHCRHSASSSEYSRLPNSVVAAGLTLRQGQASVEAPKCAIRRSGTAGGWRRDGRRDAAHGGKDRPPCCRPVAALMMIQRAILFSCFPRHIIRLGILRQQLRSEPRPRWPFLLSRPVWLRGVEMVNQRPRRCNRKRGRLFPLEPVTARLDRHPSRGPGGGGNGAYSR